jgi:hypothetical protein
MRDLVAEVEKLARNTGNWTGKVDENVRQLYLQEAAVNLAKRSIKESGEQHLTAADKIAQFNTQVENLKVVLGDLVAGPLGSFVGMMTDFLKNFTDGENNEVEKLSVQIDGLLRTIKKLDENDVSLWERLIGGIFGVNDSNFFKEQLENVKKELLQLTVLKDGLTRTGRAFKTDKPSGSGGRQGGAPIASLIANLEQLQELSVRSNENFKGLFETVEENAPGFENALAKGRYELEQYRILAQEIGGIIEGAFTNLADGLVDGATKGSEAWGNFFEDLKRQITRFLVSQIVRTFLNFFFSAVGLPGAGSFFGATIFGGASTGTAGVFGGASSSLSSGGGSILSGGGNFALGNLTAPQPLPASSGGFITKQSYIEKTTPVSGRIIVETIAPELTRVKQYHIDVEDNISEPHRNQKQRRRRSGSDDIWK